MDSSPSPAPRSQQALPSPRAWAGLAVALAAALSYPVAEPFPPPLPPPPPRSSPPLGLDPTPKPSSAPAPLPSKLSETGLHGDGVLAYSPQYPLWSDGAAKRRWIFVPPGESIDGSDPDDWVLPAGTRFWKEFGFGQRVVETRYLEKLEDGSLRFASYRWDAALGDAVLVPEQGAAGVYEMERGKRHDIPSRADCRACHEGRRSRVLGFNALQLSPDRDPLAAHGEAPPPGAVDLADLVARGLLRGFPRELLANPPRVAGASPIERAARGYLFGNCSGCHNASGPLAALGLDFDQSVVAAGPPPSLQRASRFRLPGEQASLRVARGRPERSAVWFRMQSRDPFMQMPPLGTKLVDRAGTALIARWISTDLETTTHQGR